MSLIHYIPISEGSVVDRVTGLSSLDSVDAYQLHNTVKGFMYGNINNDSNGGVWLSILNSEQSTNNGSWSLSFGFIVCNYCKAYSYQSFITKLNNSLSSGWNITTNGKNAGIVRLITSNGQKTITFHVNYGTYYHVILLYNIITSKIELYIDGKLNGSISTLGMTLINNVDKIRIGTYYNNSGLSQGSKLISTTSIYDHALSQQEIDKLYAEWLQPKPTINLIKESVVSLSNEYNEEGLIAAFSGQLSPDRKWIDKSGNGNTLVARSRIVNANNGIMVGNKSHINTTTSPNIVNTINGGLVTICYRGMFYDGGINSIVSLGSTVVGGGSKGVGIFHNNTSITYEVYGDNGGRQSISTPKLIKTEVTLHLVFDNFNNKLKLYINGVLYNSKDIIHIDSFTLSNDIYLGHQDSKKNIITKEVKVYNRILSDNEIKAYHNKWVQPVLTENFNYGADGVVKSIPNWIRKSGTWRIKELTENDSVLKHLVKGTKYLECATAGNIAIPSQQAYGTWEFDLYKGSDFNTIRIQLIYQNMNPDIGTNTGGYSFLMFNDERLYLQKNGSNLLLTSTSYIQNLTWYRIKLTRSELGLFTIYIKGGAFGNDWTLVSTTGGSGTNPVTDNTYTTSNYFVLDIGAGDKITNLQITNGIKQ